jgi:hypothetical protein
VETVKTLDHETVFYQSSLNYTWNWWQPVAVPMPIKEEPALAMIARTSAKSTFTSPGTCN